MESREQLLNEMRRLAGELETLRETNGTWSQAVSLGEKINAVHSHIPSLSPDGKFIFFNRDGDIWWAGTGVIERLRNEKKKGGIDF